MKKCALLCGLLICALCFTACASSVQEAPELLEPVGVQMNTEEVRRGEIYEMEAFEFFVSPGTEEVLYTVDGNLEEVCVIPGEQVQEGDVLLKLDVETVQEQLEDLDERIRYLNEDNALTLKLLEMDVAICEYEMQDARNYSHGTKKEQEKFDEYDRVKTALEQEKERQELEMQQLMKNRELLAEQIEHSVLTAPMAGTVVYIAQTAAGAGVRAGDTAFVLATDELQLKGDFISEATVESADEIEALVGPYSCQVEYLPMDQEEYISLMLSGGEMTTKFRFADGAPEGVQMGDFAAVLVKTRQRKDVLYLPPNAVERDAKGDYVYLMDEAGERERHYITIGYRNTTAIEIADGLQEGDVVYVQ